MWRKRRSFFRNQFFSYRHNLWKQTRAYFPYIFCTLPKYFMFIACHKLWNIFYFWREAFQLKYFFRSNLAVGSISKVTSSWAINNLDVPLFLRGAKIWLRTQIISRSHVLSVCRVYAECNLSSKISLDTCVVYWSKWALIVTSG